MKKALVIAACLAAAVMAAALFRTAIPEVSPRDTRDVDALAPYARDNDLLTEEQKREARETGFATYESGGIRYVVEDMPEEYIY